MSQPRQQMAKLASYVQAHHLDKLVQEMMTALFKDTPDEPVQFMIRYLQNKKAASLPVLAVEGSPEKNPQHTKRRAGVSAEPVSMEELNHAAPTRFIAKSEADKASILQAVKTNILFSGLDAKQMDIVINATQRRRYRAGDSIITQGEDGDEFYVMDEGVCECFIEQQGKSPKKVKVYRHGESFGELALMYNTARAATIKAAGDVSVWAIDRNTFRRLLLDTTSVKRRRYEQFLQSVPILESMDKYERAKVADALITREYQDGEYIIRQGDLKDLNLYFLEEGEAKATKKIQDELTEVMRYHMGDYFGELALVNNDARKANVIAVGACKCCLLDRDSFTRLLGPVQEIITRHTNTYAKIERRLSRRQSSRRLEGREVAMVFEDEPINFSDLAGEQSDDEKDDEPAAAVAYMSRNKRRTGVSAEPLLAAEDDYKFPHTVKTQAQLSRIKTAISHNFLFTSLDAEQYAIVTGAMFEKRFGPGEAIINQGDDGDNFYVVDSGVCECFLFGKLVKVYELGETFGELALMYNTPRAATIKAKSDVVVWGLDRVTFRRMIMDTAGRNRKLYESLLESIPLLSPLDKYERAKVADALVEVTFQADARIITQGDVSDDFYLIAEGSARVIKMMDDGQELEVLRYRAGDYFGELGLLNNATRAATVIAVTNLRCVKLDRESFTRLLGPIQDLLKRQSNVYHETERRISLERAASPPPS